MKRFIYQSLLVAASVSVLVAQDLPSSTPGGGATPPDNSQPAPVAPDTAPPAGSSSASSTTSTTSTSTTPPDPKTRDPLLESLPAAPVNDTVISSSSADMDQTSRTVICNGTSDQQVTVVGNNFRMRCNQLTAYFNKNNKIDHMIANGNVVIEQPDRLTHAGHAVFTQDDNKIVLTEDPKIRDGDRDVVGKTILIYRGKNTMTIEQSKITLPGSTASSTTPAPAPSAP